MKLKLLVALLAAGTIAVAAQSQEVRVVTMDTQGPMPAGMAAGNMPMPLGSAVVFGQVTEADSNRPVPGAIVTLTLAGAQPLRVMADGQGRFGFKDLPKGRFGLTATKPGWVDGAYGRTRPAGPTLPLALTDGEKASGLVVPIWRYASIAGTVVDESGDALVNVPVRVMKRSTIGGKMRLTPAQSDSTDDRGVYRVGMLEPGDYVVVVPMQQPFSEMAFAPADNAMREVMTVRATAVAASAGGGGGAWYFNGPLDGGSPAGVGEDGRPLSFPTVFYPNVAASTRATVITVSSGEERGAVDFQLRGVPTSKISGTASGPDGPVPNLQVTLTPGESEDTPSSIETLNGMTDAAGRFTIEGVPPGQYILRAVRTPRVAMGPGEVTTIQQGNMVMVTRSVTSSGAAPLPTDPTLWAEMSLAVGAKDLADVSVGLRPGVKMTGMIQFNGGAERPTPDRMGSIGITLEPADPRPGISAVRGRVETNGAFATMGVPPGRYFLRVNGTYPNWTFQSAQANGRDASVTAIDLESADVSGVILTFTDRPSELSGQVEVDGPPEATTVLVFPAESSAWVGYGNSSRRFSNARVDKQGAFKITNLPAGDYLAVAIPDKMANDWQNPKFLESLVPQATRLRVRDGEATTTSLKVAR